MVKLTKIYTKSGDKGKTSLGNGNRVQKTAIRIEAIGAVDELNSVIGMAFLHVKNEDIKSLILNIQNNLFDIGADLSVPSLDKELDYTPLRIKKDQVEHLEKMIDKFNAELNTLDSFILPGGSKSSAHLHFARTVTRRAERLVCHLIENMDKNNASCLSVVLMYINRLSDLLFVLARYENNKGASDIKWVPGK